MQQLQHMNNEQYMHDREALMHEQHANEMQAEQAMVQGEVMQAPPATDNPFERMGFNGSQTPLPQPTSMAEVLLADTGVPDAFKENFWFVFNKDNVLTFLDQKRKEEKLLSFEILKIDSLAATPYHEYSFEKERDWTLARLVLETKLDRALGMDKSTGINERKTLQSQFSENRQINELNKDDNGLQSNGFFSRLLKRK